MTPAEGYIREVWRNENAARVKRGARQLDVHDRELFCMGINAALAVAALTDGNLVGIADAVQAIERMR